MATPSEQLLVRATKARNNVTELPHGTSLLDIRAALPEPAQVATKNGMHIYSLPAALVACSKQSFTQNPTDMRAVLSMVSDASEVLEQLLEGGHSSIAGRLAGAFSAIKLPTISWVQCARRGMTCVKQARLSNNPA